MRSVSVECDWVRVLWSVYLPQAWASRIVAGWDVVAPGWRDGDAAELDHGA